MGFGRQLHWAGRFIGEPHTRIPTIAIWVATFSGALHDPLTSFFLLELGASPSIIGKMYAAQTFGALCLSPVYGYLLDMRLIVLPALASSFCCAFGCLLRGLCPKDDMILLFASHVVLGLGAANFWNVVGAYLVMSFTADDRTNVVSAFRLQIQVLSLLGKSLYTPMDSALMSFQDDTLSRYRISMSFCSILCVAGFFLLAVRRNTLERPAEVKRKMTEESPVAARYVNGPFVLACAAFFLQSTAIAMFTRWPLYLKETYQWDARTFSGASLGISFGSIVLLAWGAKMTLLGPSLILSVILALVVQWMTSVIVHVVVGVLLASLLIMQRPLFESKGSMLVTPGSLGRAMMALNISQGFGSVVGNWTGPLVDSWLLVVATLCAGSYIVILLGSPRSYTVSPVPLEFETPKPVATGRGSESEF